jgi:hypothetical protein
MRITRCLLLAVMMLAVAAGVWAQQSPATKAPAEDVKKLAGYVEFDASKLWGQEEPKVNLFVDQALLTVLIGAMKEDQPELAELLQDVKLIQVQVLRGQGTPEGRSLEKVSELIKGLKERQGWNPIVSVTENGKNVDILLKTQNDVIVGLALFVAGGGEFVFINIAGEFKPETLGGKLRTLISKLNEGGLDLSRLGAMFGNLQSTGSGAPGPQGPAAKSKEPSLVIRGVIKAATTGQPIEGAQVSDDGYGPQPYKGAVTDAAGTYRFVTWPEEHNVVAKAPGYKPQRRTIDAGLLQAEKEIVFDFSLEAE